MEKHVIEYDGKEYTIQEPTIELWNQLQILKDLYTEKDFGLLLISIATGLEVDELKDADWLGVYEASNTLAEYFMTKSEQFYNEFDFQGQKYRFIDLENLTFGEFIDIDEFLKQPLVKRQSQLHMLMALFYREVGDDGKIEKYDASKLKHRSDIFRFLPVKYLNGAMRFFFHLENILQRSTRSFFHKMLWRMKWKLQRLLRVFGGGIQHLYIYVMRTYSNYKKWLVNRFWKYSTF